MAVSPSEIEILYNDYAVFNCSALGGPNNQYMWLRNGALIGHDEPDLIIGMATLDDEGVYQCVVSNMAGSENASATLNG